MITARSSPTPNSLMIVASAIADSGIPGRGSLGCGGCSVYSVLAKVMITQQAASCFWTIGRFVQTGENERAVPLVEQSGCYAMQ